jgi:MIP family channel proteins
VQERGLAAYLAELIGTFLLVFFITSVVVLFVSTGEQAQFGSDFAVIGLVHAFLLFGLIVMFGVVSGGHFNPAVTLAAAAIKRISAIDALIYMLAQFSGGVLGALLCKGLLLDEGRATHYGAASVSGILGGNFQGAIVEAIGTFCLVLVILAAVFSKKSFKDWAPLAIGTTLGFIVMVGGPLTGGSFNPARWFGPALVGNEWGGVWPYLLGPIVGSLLAAAVFRFVLEAGGKPPTESPERIKPPSPAAS